MKKLFISILWFLSIFIAFSQEKEIDKNNIDEIIDELLIDELLLDQKSIDELITSLTNFQFLYTSVNYNSDTYFSGRDIDIDQYKLPFDQDLKIHFV